MKNKFFRKGILFSLVTSSYLYGASMEGFGQTWGWRSYYAGGISSDGNTIVGYTTPTLGFKFEAFMWRESSGKVKLGDFDGGDFKSASTGVSSDGSIVVGYGTSASGTEAFRWTQADGMVGLGDLAGGEFNSVAYDVSGNGSVIVVL